MMQPLHACLEKILGSPSQHMNESVCPLTSLPNQTVQASQRHSGMCPLVSFPTHSLNANQCMQVPHILRLQALWDCGWRTHNWCVDLIIFYESVSLLFLVLQKYECMNIHYIQPRALIKLQSAGSCWCMHSNHCWLPLVAPSCSPRYSVSICSAFLSSNSASFL